MADGKGKKTAQRSCAIREQVLRKKEGRKPYNFNKGMPANGIIVPMNAGSVILSLVKASPDDFLAGLKSLSNQERVEVDRKMRQLEDKHQDEFSKDSGRREQSRRGFLSTLGLGAAGVGAAVASKLLPGSKVVGDQAPKAAPAPALSEGQESISSGSWHGYGSLTRSNQARGLPKSSSTPHKATVPAGFPKSGK